MPAQHPTIDLINGPDTSCFLPVYNCIRYCFEANDYQLNNGGFATFELSFDGTSSGQVLQDPVDDIFVLGQAYTQGSPASAYEMDFPATGTTINNDTFWQIILDGLQANSYINNLFTFQISGATQADKKLIAVAKQVGVVPNFTFDWGNIANKSNGDPRIITTSTQGFVAGYRPNYKLVVELWQCPANALRKLLSTEGYVPLPDGTMCINLEDKFASLVATSFEVITTLASPTLTRFFADRNISTVICMRYGEQYSNDLLDCNTDAKVFVDADPMIVYNAAFPRDRYNEYNDKVCTNQFMTNSPEYLAICPDVPVALWVNLKEPLEIVDAANPGDLVLGLYYQVVYTDGSIDQLRVGTITSDSQDDGFKAVVASHPASVTGLSINPSLKVAAWEVRVGLVDKNQANHSGGTAYSDVTTWYGTHWLEADDCCSSNVQLFFLNQYGGYDVILFENLILVDPEQEPVLFEGQTGCSPSFKDGLRVTSITGYPTYTITSKPNRTYPIAWLQEMLDSPDKKVRFVLDGREVFSSIVVLEREGSLYEMANNQGFMNLTFRLNTHSKNQTN